MQYCQRERHINQENKIENSDIDSQKNMCLNDFFKKMQKQLNEGKIAFSINGAGMVRYPYSKKKKKTPLDLTSHFTQNITQNGSTHLDRKHKTFGKTLERTIKFLELKGEIP